MIRVRSLVFTFSLGMILALGGGIKADPNWCITLTLASSDGSATGHSFTAGCAVDAVNAKATLTSSDAYDRQQAPLPAD